MFIETRTSMIGAALALCCLSELNIVDLRADPGLLAELTARLNDPAGFVYGRESPDVWTSWAVEAWRRKQLARGDYRRSRLPVSTICGPRGTGGAGDGPIRADCEEFAALCAAWAICTGAASFVEAVVTQPHGHGVAHAYTRIDGQIKDLAVFYGMRKPPPPWYLQGETAAFRVTSRVPSLYVPIQVS